MTARIESPEALSSAFDGRLNQGDLDGMMDLIADGAVSRTPQEDVLTDRDQIRANFADMIKAHAVLHNTPKLILPSGDLALMLIDYTLDIDTPDGRVSQAGTTANVARHDADGGWRLAVLNPRGTT